MGSSVFCPSLRAWRNPKRLVDMLGENESFLLKPLPYGCCRALSILSKQRASEYVGAEVQPTGGSGTGPRFPRKGHHLIIFTERPVPWQAPCPQSHISSEGGVPSSHGRECHFQHKMETF